MDDIQNNQIEAYGPKPLINKVGTRILPFIDTKTGEPWFTLIVEHFDDKGKVSYDSRRWMDEAQFLNLCGSAATAYDRLREQFGYERKKMIRLISFLFSGCWHQWEIRSEDQISRHGNIYAYLLMLKCSKCGNIKRKRIDADD